MIAKGAVYFLLLLALSTPCVPAQESRGKAQRSRSTRVEFMKRYPCPYTGLPKGTCPGYVVTYVKPLNRGGKDVVDNLQWIAKPQARGAKATSAEYPAK